MTPDPPGEDVTTLLSAIGRGDSEAVERLFPVIYDELHRIASRFMQQERRDHTLQPTALVHEAYLRLVGKPGDASYENRAHFLATAAVAMRRILINHAKARSAQKRGLGRQLPALDGAFEAFEERAIDLLALDEALGRLAELDATQGKLVELRFFGGMSVEDCARFLGISERTLHYEWSHARAWLRGQLQGV
jgi:RNA polymerase sigma factor (TIGR02999 family)